MAVMTMIDAIRQAMLDEMERDERVILMGQDIGHLGGVFRATDGLQQRFTSKRVIDTPLAESVIMGSAYGLALTGLVPVVEIQFLGFTQNCFHQICQQVARSRFRTRGDHPAQITIRSPFGGNVRTPEFHSDSMEAVFAQSTGLKIVMPSTASSTRMATTASAVSVCGLAASHPRRSSKRPRPFRSSYFPIRRLRAQASVPSRRMQRESMYARPRFRSLPPDAPRRWGSGSATPNA